MKLDVSPGLLVIVALQQYDEPLMQLGCVEFRCPWRLVLALVPVVAANRKDLSVRKHSEAEICSLCRHGFLLYELVLPRVIGFASLQILPKRTEIREAARKEHLPISQSDGGQAAARRAHGSDRPPFACQRIEYVRFRTSQLY